MTPEQERALALARARRRRQESQGGAVQAQETPGVLSDVVASGASGVARGAADLVGLPGTIADAVTAGGRWALRSGYELATGAEPSTDGGAVERFFAGPSPEVESQLLGGNVLSGERMRDAASAVTGGATDYQPYTTAGEYSRTLGEFLPGAAALGGGSTASLLRNAVAPALASESAGQVTEGSDLEPYARIAGALLGGGAANSVGRTSAKLPTAAEIKQSAGYGQLDDAMRNAKLTGNTYKQIVGDIWKDANDFGLTTDLKSRFGGTLRDFLQRAEASGGASLHDLELLRRSLRNAAGNTLDKSSQALSGRLVEKLDGAVDALSASSIAATGQTGKPVVEALKEARETYRVGIKSQMVEDAMQRAQSAASGMENGLRVEFRKLVNNPKMARNFTSVEKEAMRSVAEGNFSTNALRWLGTFGVPIDQGRNFLGSLSGGGIGATIGGAVGGPAGATIGGFALPALGTAAKAAASKQTQGLAGVAEALIKGGRNASQSYGTALAANREAGRQAILRALLQSQISARIPSSTEYAPR